MRLEPSRRASAPPWCGRFGFPRGPRRPIASLLAQDGGFGLPEVMVALGVVFTTLLLFAHTLTVSLSDIGLARQRQGANALANGTIELARSLPVDTLRRGLRTTDLVGDLNITLCSGLYLFKSCGGERIVHTAGLPDSAPLVPNHSIQTVEGSPTRYNVSAYVTSVDGDPSSGPLRLIVDVTWDQKLRNGTAAKVQVETIVYSPEGCVDTSTHPVAAPCRDFYYGIASTSSGGVRTTGTVNGTPISAELRTVSARSDAQIEQVQHVQGATGATSLSIDGASPQSAGGESATSSAHDDPATAAVPPYDARSLVTGSAATLEQLVAGGQSVQISRTSGATGSTTSAIAAGLAAPGGGTQTCPTTTPPGPQTDGAACGHNWARQQGTASTQLLLSGLGSLGQATIASLAAPAEATQVQVDRQSTSAAGSLVVSGSRSFGELRLAGLPSGAPAPSGWAGHWVRLTPYRDAVSATIGDASAAPTSSITSGTVEVWNGNGYTTTNLVGATPRNLTITPVTMTNVAADGYYIDVSISGSARTGTTSTQDPAGPGSGISRTEAAASSTSPIVADFTYTLAVRDSSGVQRLNAALTIAVDLGVLSAQGDYRESGLE